MAIFITQGRLTRDFIKSGLANPEDRYAAISSLCEQAGGKLLTIPLSHGRRLARHNGHGERFDPIDMLVGLAIMWAFLRVCWALAWGPGG
jgi:hypothetical protein